MSLVPQQQFTFATSIDSPQYPSLSVLDEMVDDFSIENILSSASILAPAAAIAAPLSPPSPSSPSVPNLDTPPATEYGLHVESNGDEFASILMGEIKRAQNSMENVALLTQARTTPHLLPHACIRVPELLIYECNDLFAKVLDYNSALELVSAQITMMDIIYPQLRALLQR